MVELKSSGDRQYKPEVDVSVCMPTYNGEVYLREALCSIEAQKFKGQIEVIISDYGSTDNALEIAKSFNGSGKLPSPLRTPGPDLRPDQSILMRL
jgi:GT2 family glycosyltransferase